MFSVWRFTGRTYKEVAECACGKENLSEAYEIQHKRLLTKAYVGSSCINFFNGRYKFLIVEAKQQIEAKPIQATYIREHGDANMPVFSIPLVEIHRNVFELLFGYFSIYEKENTLELHVQVRILS